jgi:hypothetical protein
MKLAIPLTGSAVQNRLANPAQVPDPGDRPVGNSDLMRRNVRPYYDLVYQYEISSQKNVRRFQSDAETDPSFLESLEDD